MADKLTGITDLPLVVEVDGEVIDVGMVRMTVDVAKIVPYDGRVVAVMKTR